MAPNINQSLWRASEAVQKELRDLVKRYESGAISHYEFATLLIEVSCNVGELWRHIPSYDNYDEGRADTRKSARVLTNRDYIGG